MQHSAGNRRIAEKEERFEMMSILFSESIQSFVDHLLQESEALNSTVMLRGNGYSGRVRTDLIVQKVFFQS